MSFIADVVGGLIGSDSSRSAANKQLDGVRESNATNLKMFNLQNGQQQPYREAGYGALSKINALLGMPGVTSPLNPPEQTMQNFDAAKYLQQNPDVAAAGVDPYGHFVQFGANEGRQFAFKDGLQQAPNALAGGTQGNPGTAGAYAALQADPSYKFTFDQGLNALQHSAAANGGLYSGNAMKAAQTFGQGLAGTKLNEIFNRYASVAGLGQVANGQGAQAAQNYGNQVGANQMAAGNAGAFNALNQGNLATNAINGLSAYGQKNGWFGGGGGNQSGWGSQGMDNFYFGNGSSGD